MSQPIFSPDLISPTVSAALPHGYSIRPLQRQDYSAGFLDVLRVLTTVGDVKQEEFEQRFDEMKSGQGYHVLVVLNEQQQIVGTGALIVERKFIHALGLVGHIEDIAVTKDQQGKKLGLRIIQALDYVAEKVGCYKTILDCSEANEGFYVKCGFKRAGLEMAHYYEPRYEIQHGCMKGKSAGHRQNILIDWLLHELEPVRDLHIAIEDFPIVKWETQDDATLRKAGSLHLSDSKENTSLSVIGAIPWTQPTNGKSVTAEVVYIPQQLSLKDVNIKGKIVLRDFGPTAKPNYTTVFLPGLWRSNDTNSLLNTAYDRPYLGAPAQDLVNAGLGGAVGFVSMFNVPGSFLESYFDPHDGTHYRLPGVYVGLDEAKMLKAAANTTAKVTIAVNADVANATQRQIVATLPGKTNDTIYIVCHTDGNTWVQDDGLSALLNLARYFSSFGTSARNKTLRFVFTTGHLGSNADTSFNLAARLDATYDTDDTVFVFALEHLGTREVLPRGSPSGAANGQPLEFTGKSEIVMWSVGPSDPLRNASIAAAKKYDLDRMLVTQGTGLQGGNVVPEYNIGGIANGFHNHLIPTTSLISGPWSLWAPSFGESAIDFDRLRQQTLAVAEVILAMDGLSKREIAGRYWDMREARKNGTRPGFNITLPAVFAPAPTV
ncbi:hypothetical protein AMS68_006597 [Peltaster fructicola]|uniref:N-acetyltransferase domain-containing protein n=1 Tax=Peltaster fructicola TaxID=286661 RepID=A0A6H0Y351_9PEZI|nr:hypothetical protein AMS68_006597 [Peltaster fructicola]